MRKDINSQTEKAVVAYLMTSVPTTVLETCSVYAGGLFFTPTVITPPWIIITASMPEQIGYDSGIYELHLSVSIATQVDDEMQSATDDLHRDRVEALRDMLEDVATLMAGVNAPASGPDNRTVQSFTLSSILYEDAVTKMLDRKLVSELTYCVTACPQG